MSSTLSPNMSLVIPGVGTEAGPQYATDINSSLTIIDQHNHAAGSGVQITPSGLNINSSLPMNNNSLTFVAAVTLSPQTFAPTNGSLYEDTSGLLHYIDGSGNDTTVVKAGGGVNATSFGIASGTASAAFSGGTLVVDSDVNKPGDIQCGSILLGNIVTGSHFLTLQPPNAMGADYSLTLPSVPAQTNVMTIDASGNMGSTTYDAVGQNMTSVGADAIATTMGATGANIIAADMTSTGTNSIISTMGASGANSLYNNRTVVINNNPGLGGVVTSSSCGSFSTTSTSPVQITNLSGTITTSGRPIEVAIIPYPANTTAIYTSGSTNLFAGQINLNIDGVDWGTVGIPAQAIGGTMASLRWLATVTQTGAHTISILASVASGATLFVQNFYLVAYEI